MNATVYCYVPVVTSRISIFSDLELLARVVIYVFFGFATCTDIIIVCYACASFFLIPLLRGVVSNEHE